MTISELQERLRLLEQPIYQLQLKALTQFRKLNELSEDPQPRLPPLRTPHKTVSEAVPEKHYSVFYASPDSKTPLPVWYELFVLC